MSENSAVARREDVQPGNRPDGGGESAVETGRADQRRADTAESKERPALAPSAVSAERDLRLDLFRGIALWLIFLDHIPTNIVNWFTIRNYGFSDATEIFIFISGYTAAFVYGKSMRERGLVIAGARILRRAWQIYVAHIFLFAIFMAQIAYFQASSTVDNPVYAEEVNATDFLSHPDQTIIQALILAFKPSFMDILPLYIVLLLLFPPILWLLQRSATAALGLSVLLYALSWHFHWNLKSYPSGVWFFNPFAWQLLFVFGAWCALGGAERMSRVLRSRITLGIAGAYLLFAFAIAMTWYFPRFIDSVLTDSPRIYWMYRSLTDWMYPIDKTNLDVLRFAHFLALATVTVHFVHRSAPWLKSKWLRPAILCGQHSLEIFCLGVFLSFAAHFATVEIYPGVLTQVVVSFVGVFTMIATAALISWYKVIERGSGPPKRTPDADLAGGQV